MPLELLLVLIATTVVPAAIIGLVVLRQRIVCKPGELWVFAGRGEGFQVLHRPGETRLRIPIIERADRMSTTPIPFEGRVTNAFTKGNVPVTLRIAGKVRISTASESLMRNAVERFLGREDAEIAGVAIETLEGELRSIAAAHTPGELGDGPLIARELLRSAQDAMDGLGLAPTDLTIEREDRNP